MRGRMNPGKSYVPPFEEGKPLNGSGCGRVIESKNADYHVNDILTSQRDLTWPWREKVIFDNDRAGKFTKINQVPDHLISHTIGQLGMPGLTAYFGVIERGLPKEGETFVVSGGAGACGSIAGQIAKLRGCLVIGIASSQEKLDYMLNELSFDFAVNYSGKSEEELFEDLKLVAKNGVDIYYDNVGGIISNAVLRLMNKEGRVPICGQISQYNKEEMDILPPSIENDLKEKNVTRGWFMVFNFKDQFEAAWNNLFNWVNEGKIKVHQTIFEGIDQMPHAFLALFTGENIGKLVVKIK